VTILLITNFNLIQNAKAQYKPKKHSHHHQNSKKLSKEYKSLHQSPAQKKSSALVESPCICDKNPNCKKVDLSLSDFGRKNRHNKNRNSNHQPKHHAQCKVNVSYGHSHAKHHKNKKGSGKHKHKNKGTKKHNHKKRKTKKHNHKKKKTKKHNHKKVGSRKHNKSNKRVFKEIRHVKNKKKTKKLGQSGKKGSGKKRTSKKRKSRKIETLRSFLNDPRHRRHHHKKTKEVYIKGSSKQKWSSHDQGLWRKKTCQCSNGTSGYKFVKINPNKKHQSQKKTAKKMGKKKNKDKHAKKDFLKNLVTKFGLNAETARRCSSAPKNILQKIMDLSYQIVHGKKEYIELKHLQKWLASPELNVKRSLKNPKILANVKHYLTSHINNRH